MAKIHYIEWNITYIAIKCDCKEVFKIQPIKNQLENEQAEHGEIEVSGTCPFCQKKISKIIDLEDFNECL